LALFLAALGLYGLIHYTVQRRRREFGLRMALGAAPRTVARVVLSEALLLVGIGVAVGLAVAIPLARFVATLLFRVTPTDVYVLLAATALMGTIAIIATALPAWRAARTDPLQALRM
jgi:ABC-type antimicrobial peptide transport system permease subunit